MNRIRQKNQTAANPHARGHGLINDDWNGWMGMCRHCHRGTSVAGKLNKRGFCKYCRSQGYDSFYID